MPRTEVIKVIVSKEEKDRAEQIAAEQGLPVSTWLRRMIKLEPLPVAQPPTKQPA